MSYRGRYWYFVESFDPRMENWRSRHLGRLEYLLYRLGDLTFSAVDWCKGER